MRRLMGVELTRLRWRRAVLVLLLLALIVPVLVFAITAWNTRPYSEAEQADIQVQVDRATQAPRSSSQRCLDNPED